MRRRVRNSGNFNVSRKFGTRGAKNFMRLLRQVVVTTGVVGGAYERKASRYFLQMHTVRWRIRLPGRRIVSYRRCSSMRSCRTFGTYSYKFHCYLIQIEPCIWTIFNQWFGFLFLSSLCFFLKVDHSLDELCMLVRLFFVRWMLKFI